MYLILNILRNIVLMVVYLILLMTVESFGDDKITYISVERPNLTYYTKYVTYANLTSRRYGRANPVYYVDFSYESKIQFDNNVKLDFYFYEFLTNRYKPSFVEMHFRFCELIHKDPIFGAPLKQGKLDGPCPYPPGEYNMSNMTILPEAIPRGFPFTKGRIYANLSLATTKETIGTAHIDMELRQMKVIRRPKNSKL